MDDNKLLSLIGNLYEATIEPQNWPRVLEEIQSVLNGGAYAHFLWNKETMQVPLMYFTGFSPQTIKAYQEYFSSIEPGANFIRANTELGVFQDSMWIDEHAMDRNEYHAWLERESGMRYRLGGLVVNSDKFFGITALQRSRRQGPAGEHEYRLFLRLLPHIRRATRISQEFSTLRNDRMTLLDVFHQAQHGIMFIDERGRVIFANRAAEGYLAQRDGLWFDRSGCLRACNSGERPELERLIAVMIETSARNEEHPGGTIAIFRPSGKRPFGVTVTPFPVVALEDFLKTRAIAAVFVVDPETTRAPSEAFFRGAYGLTPAESRLALKLLSTDSLKDAADQMGLTEGSTRQTLKRVFSKTDCHSQAALMRLILSHSTC